MKVHKNKLGSNWLKELVSQPLLSRNHRSINNDDNIVLLGDIIIIAPPIKQLVLAKAEAISIAATNTANNYASDDLDH